MGQAISYTLISVIFVSLVSLVGIFALMMNEARVRRWLFFLISFAVGVLLGDAFLHLIPETFHHFEVSTNSMMLILSGFLGFFLLEKAVHFHHLHIHETEGKYHPVIYTNLVGDALHNFIDGILIAGSFYVSVGLGVATTAAVILHEIPQEIGDFGILVHGGMKPRQALKFNFLSAIFAIVGALVGILLINSVEEIEKFLIPITAGGFIYIAASDLVPELHRKTHEGQRDEHISPKSHHLKIWVQALGILLGILLMLGFTFLETESHGSEEEVHMEQHG